MSLATTVTSKGHNAYAVSELRRFILEVGRTHGILQSDQEPSIRAVLRSVATELGGRSLRASPTYSSQGQSSGERIHATLYFNFEL